MDIKRLKTLRDHLDTPEVREHFNMNHFFYNRSGLGDERYHPVNRQSFFNCGTAACIAGWAVQLFGDEAIMPNALIDEYAAVLLNLNEVMAEALFVPEVNVSFLDITVDDAILAINNLIDRGSPHWEEIIEKYLEFEDEDAEES